MAKATTPAHIGFILDGNRRWAKANNKSTFSAHRMGYEKIKEIALGAFDRGVKFISVYALSTENWNRSEKEVNYLMDLAFSLATSEVDELNKKNIRVIFLGCQDRLSTKMIKAIERAEELTKSNTYGTVAICFNYGGQLEIVDAVKKILSSNPHPSEVTVDLINKNLYAPEVPPVDLVVRTSGEQRLSNFMLWRIAYSELIFVQKYWPDFNQEDLDEILNIYAGRERRFGGGK